MSHKKQQVSSNTLVLARLYDARSMSRTLLLLDSLSVASTLRRRLTFNRDMLPQFGSNLLAILEAALEVTKETTDGGGDSSNEDYKEN